MMRADRGTTMNQLEPFEIIVLENLVRPAPGEVPDIGILRRLEERGLVIKPEGAWLLTPAGFALLAAREKRSD